MKYFIFFFLFVILFSCNSIKVINVKYVNKIPKNYFIYALPKNKISIDIEVTENKTMHGPYFEFAEKYLGIKNVPQENYSEYFISKTNIKVIGTPDSENMYFIIPGCKNKLESISLTDNGIISSINCKNNNVYDNETTNNYINNFAPFQNIVFKDLSQKNFINVNIDTIWKQVKVDTNFIRIPIQKKTVDTLSFEDKAKEAAHHILRLRKRLFKLLTGAYEKAPNINQVSDVINELKKEEEEYLSLFIGKTFSRKLNYNYTVIPENNDSGKKLELGYFNIKQGITKNNFSDNQPIVLEINSTGTLSNADSAFIKYNKASDKKGFTYRIPETVDVYLIIGENVITEKQLQISQLGVLCNLPVNYFNKKHFAEFNPVFGNIVKIGKK